jgi:hypothetical protein
LKRLLLLLFWGFAACSRLPSYARPQGSLLQPGSFDDSDLIEYRTLTREDFRGEKPDGDAAEHMDAMGATTFAILRSDPSVRILVTEEPDAKADQRFRGRLDSRLHFRAQMDRKRSWWNPNLKEVPFEYVLQHEQIHFALAAIEAKTLNASSDALTKSVHAEGDSAEKVKSDIDEKLSAVIRGALSRLVDRNANFDEDTSARYSPKKQAEWWRRVQAELGAASH